MSKNLVELFSVPEPYFVVAATCFLFAMGICANRGQMLPGLAAFLMSVLLTVMLMKGYMEDGAYDKIVVQNALFTGLPSLLVLTAFLWRLLRHSERAGVVMWFLIAFNIYVLSRFYLPL